MSRSPLIAHLLFAVMLFQSANVAFGQTVPCGNLTSPAGSCKPGRNTCPFSCPTSEEEEEDDTCDGSNMFNAYNGNVHRSIPDLRLFGSIGSNPLSFTRDSNSRMATMNQSLGAFGRETVWSHNHLWYMRAGGTAANGQPIVRIGMPDGYDESFVRDATDPTLWLPVANSPFSLRQNGNIFEHGNPSGGIARFERRTHTTSGGTFYRISQVEDVSGSLWTYSYNTPNETIVRQVTDESGRWLKLTYINAGNFSTQSTHLATLPRNHTQGSWQEVTVTNTAPNRILALHFNTTASAAISELEFYDENNQLINGTVFGSEPLFDPAHIADNAFDGDTSTYYRFAYARNGFIGIDTGSPGKRVSRIRYFVPAGVTTPTASGWFVGLKELNQPNNVVKEVEASDGRSVIYDYDVLTDPSGWFRWVVLEKVNYPDGTSADYSYAQSHSYTRPLLATASDPTLTGSTAQVVAYEFNPNGPIGFIAAERNPITGGVLASTGADSAHRPKAIYPNGRVVTYNYSSLNGNLTSKSDGTGRTYLFQQSQSGAGHLSQVTDPLGRVTTFTRTPLGNRLSTTYPDGTVRTYTRDSRERVVSETLTGPGMAARTTTYTRDSQGRVTRIDHPDTSFETWTYNNFGQPLSHRLLHGEYETWTYTTNGLKETYTDAGGHTTTYTYNTLDLLETVTDPLSRVTTYEYNLRGQLVKTIHPDATFTETEYNHDGLVIASSNELGHTSTYAYDEYRRKISETDPLNRTTTYDYEAIGGGCSSCNTQALPTIVTHPSGRLTAYQYDIHWNLIAETVGYDTAQAATTYYEYDVLNRRVKTIDPLGRETTQTYDNRDRVATSTNQHGLTTSMTYDGAGNTLTVTAPNTGVSSMTYDLMDQMLTQTDALNQTTAYTYDIAGRQIAVTSPLGRVSTTTYDADSQVIATATGVGTAEEATTEFEYDAGHRVVKITDPLLRETDFGYDARDRRITVTDALSRVTTTGYDDAGRVESVTHPDTTVTAYVHDVAGQLISVTDALNQTTSYTYDLDGRRTSLTDARNNTRHWSYTERGQLFRKTQPDATFDEYSYRLDGSLNTRKTPAGAVETYTYGTTGLLTGRTWSDSTSTVTYTYDSLARPVTVANGSSTVSWTYDLLNRRATETQDIAGSSARVVTYAYDDDGHLSSLTYPDANVVTYDYTDRHQLASVTSDGPPPLAQYTYDLAGQRTDLLLENGQNTASDYDAAGQLEDHIHTIGGNPLDSVAYTLDVMGRRTAIARPGAKNDTYTYDATGQVLTSTAANTGGPTSESFAYDAAGNRTSSTASPAVGVQGTTPITYAANSLDQYTTLNGQAQTHDANGNTLLLRQPTQDDVTFEWDSENRMLAQERQGTSPARIVNHYDALHRRVKKEVFEDDMSNWVLVKTHLFVYDGWNVIEEREYSDPGTGWGLSRHNRYTWGADVSGTLQGAGGVGGLLMTEELDITGGSDPAVAHYYWYDGNGNVTGITDHTSAIEGTYRYTSFGALAESTTTTAFAAVQPWKFSTKYHDPEVEPVAGTYYYGYRSYLPSVGRWPSRDPIEEEGDINLYRFVRNSAVYTVDALGLQGTPGNPITLSNKQNCHGFVLCNADKWYAPRPEGPKSSVNAIFEAAGCTKIDEKTACKSDQRKVYVAEWIGVDKSKQSHSLYERKNGDWVSKKGEAGLDSTYHPRVGTFKMYGPPSGLPERIPDDHNSYEESYWCCRCPIDHEKLKAFEWDLEKARHVYDD